MTQPSLPSFIQTYLSEHDVDFQLLERARAKRHKYGKPDVEAHWSAEEASAYELYKKARSEYQKSDEGHAGLLKQFNQLTPSLRPVTDADFDTEIVNSERPVLVQFFARWCGPCHKAGAVLEEVAQAGHRVAKLDCEASPETAKRFAVKSYPTLLLFSGSGLRGLYRGARTPELLGAWIEGEGKTRKE